MGVLFAEQSYLWLPIIYLKARKFALLFTLGSLSMLAAMALLRGPTAFCRHLLSSSRVLFIVVYLATMIGTLYCAMGLRKTVPTIICASAQA